MLRMQLFLAVVLAQTPITKVLSLLENLEKKVVLDGEVEKKQFEKFTEFCQDGAVKMQYQIKTAKATVEDLSAVIEKESATIQTNEATIAELAKKITTNEADLAGATGIRKKEAADFAAADADLAETIDMLARAVGILEKNQGSSFVQAQATYSGLLDSLHTILSAQSIKGMDTSKLQALLQDGQQSDDDFLSRSAPAAKAYESQSGSIIDTIEDMADKAKSLRNDGQRAEMNSAHSYNMLKQSLEDALKVDGSALDAAKLAKASAAEGKALAEGDLSRTQKLLAETQKALADLGADCQQKAADFQVSAANRDDELHALTQARKVLEEKAGGAASRAYGLLELASGARSAGDATTRIVSMLQGLGKKDVALAQLALRVQAAAAMSSGADVFTKVRAMIQDLVDKLVSDAAAEADHKAWCDKETAESQEKIADHQSTLEKLQARRDKAEAAIAQLVESIAQTEADLADLAKRQAAMDQMRSEQKAEFQQVKKDYTDGVEGLTMALQVLRDYYSAPALLQQPAVGSHSAASGEASGILGLLEVAQSDFSKLLAEAEVEESASAHDYEKVSQENAVSRTMKTADAKYQTKEKAALAKNVAEYKEDSEQEQAELDAVLEYFATVKPGCTTKPMSYEERKTRRASELEGLKSALAILEEQPESFLALRTVRRA